MAAEGGATRSPYPLTTWALLAGIQGLQAVFLGLDRGARSGAPEKRLQGTAGPVLGLKGSSGGARLLIRLPRSVHFPLGDVDIKITHVRGDFIGTKGPSITKRPPSEFTDAGLHPIRQVPTL